MAKSVLSPIQRQIIEYLSKDTNFIKNFYLTGGTALSEFYLHHRLSEDLDFFTETEVDKIWLNTLAKRISGLITAKKHDIQESFNRNLVFFTTSSGIIKTEFTYFPMPQITPPKIINGIPIDSEVDIAVNKLFTIYQKPLARHFIDLYLLLTTKSYKWEELEKLARAKFDANIDPIQMGSSLIQARDIQDLPRMIINLPDKKWRDYFIKKALSFKEKILK